MDTRPIGVFDSGLGGLTAVRQLRRVLPGEDIVYFGDTGRVPYGSRGRDIIVQYARQDIRFLLSRDVKFIIAACGTVSSTYPPEEAARLPVPYTGVVGATARAAVDATRNHRIGIIGTAATVRSGSYAAVIRDMLPDVQIFARACPMFVPLVENGYFNDGNPVTKLIIAEYLQELKDAGVDTLILGCTHYPLLKKMIGDFMGDAVRLVDSGKVTAQATAAALAQQVEVWGVELENGQRVTVGSEAQAVAFARQAGSRPTRIARRESSLISGTPEQVKARLDALQAEEQLDELIIDTPISDGPARLHSLRLLAQAHYGKEVLNVL